MDPSALVPPRARSHVARAACLQSSAMSTADRRPPRRQSIAAIPARCANTHELEETKRAQKAVDRLEDHFASVSARSPKNKI